MLVRMYQNATVGMTKEAYYEMCEALGSEPIEEETPVEVADFPPEVQLVIMMYNKLRDEWDYMGGNYIGKSLVGLRDIFDMFEIPIQDRKLLLGWISIIDSTRSKVYSETRANSKVSVAEE